MAAPQIKRELVAEAIAALNAAGGNRQHAADALGIAVSTLKSRLTCAARFPDLPPIGNVTEQHGGIQTLTEETLTETWLAFQANDFSADATGKVIDRSPAAVRDHVTRYAEAHNIDLKAIAKLRRNSLDDDVRHQRARDDVSSTKARLKDAARTINDLRERIADMEWGAHASFEPAEWASPARTPKKREHMPVLLTSDFQIGEVIRASETETGYGYDVETFIRRYRRLIDTTIYLSIEHSGKDWSYPGIIYERGGDTISGALHDELRETDALTPQEAVQVAFEVESAGIDKLADAFGRVEVKTPGSGGNHDRDLLKPVTKKAWAHNYDRLIEFMLRNHFRADPRVTFQISESFDVRFPVYDRNLLLTHGDRMGSRGGMGFIGPAATILRGVQKVLMEQAALGYAVDEIHHGHFHYPMALPFLRANGCMPGYSEFAKNFRMRPEPPQQYLQYYHPRRGLVDIKPIILTEA